MKRNLICLLAGSCILYIAACSPKVTTLASAPKEGPAEAIAPATPEDLAAGHGVYEGKCGSCHKLYVPSEFTQREWGKIIPSMSRKAGLTPEEHSKLTAYLLSKSRAADEKKG